MICKVWYVTNEWEDSGNELSLRYHSYAGYNRLNDSLMLISLQVALSLAGQTTFRTGGTSGQLM
jgi:hypothetical protein